MTTPNILVAGQLRNPAAPEHGEIVRDADVVVVPPPDQGDATATNLQDFLAQILAHITALELASTSGGLLRVAATDDFGGAGTTDDRLRLTAPVVRYGAPPPDAVTEGAVRVDAAGNHYSGRSIGSDTIRITIGQAAGSDDSGYMAGDFGTLEDAGAHRWLDAFHWNDNDQSLVLRVFSASDPGASIVLTHGTLGRFPMAKTVGAGAGTARNSFVTGPGRFQYEHSAFADPFLQAGTGAEEFTVVPSAPITFWRQETAGRTDAQIEELARDALAAALTAGANIALTPDDAGNTIAIAVTGLSTVATTGAYSDLTGVPDTAGRTDDQVRELARDALGDALTDGDNITITPNDAGDTITVAVTGVIPADHLPSASGSASGIIGPTEYTRIHDSIDAAHLHDTPALLASHLDDADAVLIDDSSVADGQGSQLREVPLSELDKRWLRQAAVDGRVNTGIIAWLGFNPSDTRTTTGRTIGRAFYSLADAAGTGDGRGAVTGAERDKLQAIPAQGDTANDGRLLGFDADGNYIVVDAPSGGGGSARTNAEVQELARDALGAALAAGAGISITPSDAQNTITIASTITQYQLPSTLSDLAADYAPASWEPVPGAVAITLPAARPNLTQAAGYAYANSLQVSPRPTTDVYATVRLATGTDLDARRRQLRLAESDGVTDVFLSVDDGDWVSLGTRGSWDYWTVLLTDIPLGSNVIVMVADPAALRNVLIGIGQVDGARTDAEVRELARDALGDALTAGTGISITPDDAGDTITVAVANAFTAADEAKLDGIAAGADVTPEGALDLAEDYVPASWERVPGAVAPTLAAKPNLATAAAGVYADFQRHGADVANRWARVRLPAGTSLIAMRRQIRVGDQSGLPQGGRQPVRYDSGQWERLGTQGSWDYYTFQIPNIPAATSVTVVVDDLAALRNVQIGATQVTGLGPVVAGLGTLLPWPVSRTTLPPLPWRRGLRFFNDSGGTLPYGPPREYAWSDEATAYVVVIGDTDSTGRVSQIDAFKSGAPNVGTVGAVAGKVYFRVDAAGASTALPSSAEVNQTVYSTITLRGQATRQGGGIDQFYEIVGLTTDTFIQTVDGHPSGTVLLRWTRADGTFLTPSAECPQWDVVWEYNNGVGRWLSNAVVPGAGDDGAAVWTELFTGQSPNIFQPGEMQTIRDSANDVVLLPDAGRLRVRLRRAASSPMTQWTEVLVSELRALASYGTGRAATAANSMSIVLPYPSSPGTSGQPGAQALLMGYNTSGATRRLTIGNSSSTSRFHEVEIEHTSSGESGGGGGGGGGSRTDEQVRELARDAVGTALRATGRAVVSHDDTANTITVGVPGGVLSTGQTAGAIALPHRTTAPEANAWVDVLSHTVTQDEVDRGFMFITANLRGQVASGQDTSVNRPAIAARLIQGTAVAAEDERYYRFSTGTILGLSLSSILEVQTAGEVIKVQAQMFQLAASSVTTGASINSAYWRRFSTGG